MARTNSKGKTWKQHASPYLRQALKTASRTWKPKSQRASKVKLKSLRGQRDKLNASIKKELEKG